MQVPGKLFFCGFVVALALAGTHAAPALELEECRRMAMGGDAEAQWQLGKRYEMGDGVKQNAMRAIAQYRKAADQGHREACSKLASYYESGTLVGKNPAQAAKYRAMANGDDPETAVADAEAAGRAKRFDEVEVALDYILGRNGKERDAKTGIRLLYNSAKDNPDAQRVFCQAWDRNALDLSALDDSEWALVIPWFRNAYNDGLRSSGLVLGNDAYRHGQHQAAIQYWTAAGNAGVGKAWYHLARFFDPSNDDPRDFAAPKTIRSERRAKMAYEKASQLKWGGEEDALHFVALICLYAEDEDCRDYRRAFSIISSLLAKRPNDQYLLYDYGYAGIMTETGPDINMLSTINQQLRGQSLAPATRKNYHDLQRKIQSRVQTTIRRYRPYVERSANAGYEPAAKYLRFLDSILR